MNKNNIIIVSIIALTAIIIAYFSFHDRASKEEINKAVAAAEKLITPAPNNTNIVKDTANLRIRFDTTDGKRQWVAWVDGHAVNAYVVQETNGKKFVAAKFLETLYYDSSWKQITPKNVIR